MTNISYKIAHIAAGAAGMYCGSCIRDNSLVAALQRSGVDAILIPTYTPLKTDEPGVGIDRVFYNGIRVYLEQKLPFLRDGVNFLDRWFGSKMVLDVLARTNSSTDARELGQLTISVLQGEDGNQHRELDHLVDWLAESYQPDIVQLANSMFAGMARRIRQRLNVPILCVLQGEDIFIEALIEPYKSQAKALLRERAADIDGFTATSRYYADFMSNYLDIPREKIDVVRLGINLPGHGLREAEPVKFPFTIGYLARICHEKGLHHLIDAFIRVSASHSPGQIRLRVAGYLSKRDEGYVARLKSVIDQAGLTAHVDWEGEVDRDGKIEFLNSLHLFSVPTVYQEPKGLFAIEAMANGIPLIQPAHGAFPELLERTGGGMLVPPNDPAILASAIQELIEDDARRLAFGQSGRRVIPDYYTADLMAADSIAVFNRYLGGAGGINDLKD